MALKEVDAISDAIIATEKEIAGGAWGQEETDALDETGDRSLEDLGEGLEGQHEAGDDDESEGEDAEGEEESEGEGEDAQAEAAAAAAAAKEGKGGPAKPGATEPPEGGRVPSGKLREANEARRAAETERDALKAQIEKTRGDTTSLTEKLDLVMREIATLKAAPRTEPAKPAAEAPKPPVRPDIFENPDGVFDYFDKGVQTAVAPLVNEIKNMRVETSMAIAHATHKGTFEQAFEAVNKLNPQNPDDRAIVQRIYSAPNPGEALVSWHKRQATLSEVGDDPAAYRERIAKETREALMKDPEFKKQLLADLRGEALVGADGKPRTETRLPQSLHRATGSNVGTGRMDHRAGDESDQAVADAAWRS